MAIRGSVPLRRGATGYSCILRCVQVAVLALSMAVSGVNAQIPGTNDLCSCSPTVFSFTINLSLTCDDSNIVENGGIADVSCLGPTALDETDPSDTVPVSITTVFILELNEEGVLKSTTLQGPFADGETIEYASISTYRNLTSSYFPHGIQVSLQGLNQANQTVLNTWAVDYTNDCSFVPVFPEDAQIGITQFTGTQDPFQIYCPAIDVGPTVAPSTGATTTIAPSTGATTIAPTSEGTTNAPTNTPTLPAEAPTGAPVTESPETEAPSETEAPVTEAPSETEAPVTEAPVTEAPSETETPVTEAPVTEAPVTEAPVVGPTEAPITEAPVAPPTGVPVTAAPAVTPPPATEPPTTPVTPAPVSPPTVNRPSTPAPTPKETEPPYDMSMSYSMSMSMSFDYGDVRMLLEKEDFFDLVEEDLFEFGRPHVRR